MKRAAVLLLILGVGCGKAAPPHPPVPIVPKETTDLQAIQRGPKIVLSWSYPSFTTTGTSLNEIEKIIVYRYRETGPTDEAAGSEEEIPAAVVAFDKIPGLQGPQFRKVAEELANLDAEALPGFVMGARILYTDRPAIRSDAGEPHRYTYAVVTKGRRGTSELSNLASVVPIDAPLPPRSLKAETTPPGIMLTWEPPSESVFGESAPRIAGYNIYRLPPAGGSSEPLISVNEEPVKDTTYRDTPAYGTHRYGVTAVVSGASPRIESELPLLVTAEFSDLLAPPAPAAVSALVEDEAVRVVWDAVQSPDLAGYRVYRTRGAERALLSQGLITDTFFNDPSPERGVDLIYGVTSVDAKGNESEPSLTTPVLISR